MFHSVFIRNQSCSVTSRQIRNLVLEAVKVVLSHLVDLAALVGGEINP